MEELIQTEMIKRRSGKEPEEEVSCRMCYVGIDHLESILRLQEIVRLDLPCPEIFRIDPEAYLRRQFVRRESVIAVFCNDRIIAYSIVSFPGKDADHFGRDLGMGEADLGRCAHLETTAVHPHYRGNGLQRKLCGHHLDVLKDLGFLHVCCTTSPQNYHSIRNLFFHDFCVGALKPKFGGLLRYVLHKELGAPARSWKDVRNVPSGDLEAQQQLLRDGFYGFSVSKEGPGFCVGFGKMKQV